MQPDQSALDRLRLVRARWERTGLITPDEVALLLRVLDALLADDSRRPFGESP